MTTTPSSSRPGVDPADLVSLQYAQAVMKAALEDHHGLVDRIVKMGLVGDPRALPTFARYVDSVAEYVEALANVQGLPELKKLAKTLRLHSSDTVMTRAPVFADMFKEEEP